VSRFADASSACLRGEGSDERRRLPGTRDERLKEPWCRELGGLSSSSSNIAPNLGRFDIRKRPPTALSSSHSKSDALLHPTCSDSPPKEDAGLDSRNVDAFEPQISESGVDPRLEVKS
jgi:hypothetical protein